MPTSSMNFGTLSVRCGANVSPVIWLYCALIILPHRNSLSFFCDIERRWAIEALEFLFMSSHLWIGDDCCTINVFMFFYSLWYSAVTVGRRLAVEMSFLRYVWEKPRITVSFSTWLFFISSNPLASKTQVTHADQSQFLWSPKGISVVDVVLFEEALKLHRNRNPCKTHNFKSPLTCNLP